MRADYYYYYFYITVDLVGDDDARDVGAVLTELLVMCDVGGAMVLRARGATHFVPRGEILVCDFAGDVKHLVGPRLAARNLQRGKRTHQDAGMRVVVVRRVHLGEPLLAGRVPNVCKFVDVEL